MQQNNGKMLVNVFALIVIIGIIVVSAYKSYGENKNQANETKSAHEIVMLHN